MDDKDIQRAQRWLDKHPIEIEYDDGLNCEQVTMMLEGSVQEVSTEIFEYSFEYIDIATSDLLKMCIAELDLDVTPDELWENCSVTSVVNLDHIIGHTKAYIAIGLRFDHYTYSNDYDEVEEELEKLGVNPKDVDESWPDIPDRDPLISTKDLLHIWRNATYEHGEWHALLDARSTLELFADDPEIFESGKAGAILRAGATLITHDHFNGDASLFATSLKDIVVDPMYVYNDGVMKYGIHRTWGRNLHDCAWNGVLERNEASK